MVMTQSPEQQNSEDSAPETPSRTVLDEVIDLWWAQTQNESHHQAQDDEPPSST